MAFGPLYPLAIILYCPSHSFYETVKIYCGLRFLSPLYSIAVLNLNRPLKFVSSLSFMFFWRPKEPKAPSPAKHCLRRILAAFVDKSSSKLGFLLTGTRIHNSLLLTSRKRHPSVGCCLPLKAARCHSGAPGLVRFSIINKK